MVALQSAPNHQAEIFDVPRDRKFKAAVAYYPLCSVAPEELVVPALIMIGELDDWTPATDCERWMKRRADRGAPVKLIVYPGAWHAFGSPPSPMAGNISDIGSNMIPPRPPGQSRRCGVSSLLNFPVEARRAQYAQRIAQQK